ncbi:MAG: putative amino acid-binding protein [Actinomycetia bacterium]|nr:putative amino acid-binding protein [Actinomycetes bacterium]
MQGFALWAVGSDRPGMIAGLSGAVASVGGNLSDCSMTILSGQFAMVMIITGPDALDADGIERAVAPAVAALGLTVEVRAIELDRPPEARSVPHVVSVYGADRPGIVHAITAALARAGANVTDLETRVVGAPEAPVYTMMLEVSLPVDVVLDDLRAELEARAEELGVDVSIHAADSDVL